MEHDGHHAAGIAHDGDAEQRSGHGLRRRFAGAAEQIPVRTAARTAAGIGLHGAAAPRRSRGGLLPRDQRGAGPPRASTGATNFRPVSTASKLATLTSLRPAARPASITPTSRIAVTPLG